MSVAGPSRPRSGLERRALRRRPAQARSRRRDRRRGARARRRGVLVLRLHAHEDAAPAGRGAHSRATRARGRRGGYGELDAAQVLEWRDWVTSGRDDSWHVGWIAEVGKAELVRGDARVVRPGAVEVDGRALEYAHLVVATGSEPAVPPIDGIGEVEYWTNREAVWADGPPRSLVVIGAGPVGGARAVLPPAGARVTVLASSAQLLGRVDREAGELLRERFEDEGIELRFEVQAERVEKTDAGVRLHTSDGDAVEAEQLLVATGRKPNVEGFGLEQLGVEITKRGITVDERMRAGEGVWAIGDPTGVQLLTHVGKYQARVAAANIAGRDYVADYRAIPAAVFTDPPVATVGAPTATAWSPRRTASRAAGSPRTSARSGRAS